MTVCTLTACGSDEIDTGLAVKVYADWDRSGSPGTDEKGIPAIEVDAAAAGRAETEQDGVATIEADAGSYSVHLMRQPPGWRVTTPPELMLQVTEGSLTDGLFGIRPDIAEGRIPFKVVLTGDSITAGYVQNADFSYSVDGYGPVLQQKLAQHFGQSVVPVRALPGTKAACGVAMLESRLSGETGSLQCGCVPHARDHRPNDPNLNDIEVPEWRDVAPLGPGAYLLILYGTNDLNHPTGCVDLQCRNCVQLKCPDPGNFCQTAAYLETMVLRARQAGVIPVLGTLPPGFRLDNCNNGTLATRWNQEFNTEIDALNAQIRDLARRTNTPLADFWKAFKSPKSPPLQELISDPRLPPTATGANACPRGLHPTRRGYALMAEVAFYTITGQPSPYEDTPLPKTVPLDKALADYQAFVEETGFQPEPLPEIRDR